MQMDINQNQKMPTITNNQRNSNGNKTKVPILPNTLTKCKG